MTQVATKAEFAALVGVTPGRVSQYIAEGKLGPAEMAGTGRFAKIRVEAAMAALKLRLDMGQMTGNGLGTKLQSPMPEALPTDGVDLAFKKARLAAQLATNRKLEEEERSRQGLYVLADEAKAEMTRMAGYLLQSFEGGLADIANSIAADHKLPARDIQHALRSHFRTLRERLAERFEKEGVDLPALIEVEDDATGESGA
jgi:hypothetical protein